MTPRGDKRRVNVTLTLHEAKAALAGDYDLLLERVRLDLEDNEVRYPDCLSPPGARHYCFGRSGYVRNGDFGPRDKFWWLFHDGRGSWGLCPQGQEGDQGPYRTRSEAERALDVKGIG